MLVQLFMTFFITSIFFCSLIFVFSLKIKLFVLGLSFDFLVFFVLLYLDLKVVFKRIFYPVLSWCVFPVWVPWVFFD